MESSNNISQLKKLEKNLSDRDIEIKDFLKKVILLINSSNFSNKQKVEKIREIANKCQPLIKMDGMSTQSL